MTLLYVVRILLRHLPVSTKSEVKYILNLRVVYIHVELDMQKNSIVFSKISKINKNECTKNDKFSLSLKVSNKSELRDHTQTM